MRERERKRGGGRTVASSSDDGQTLYDGSFRAYFGPFPFFSRRMAARSVVGGTRFGALRIEPFAVGRFRRRAAWVVGGDAARGGGKRRWCLRRWWWCFCRVLWLERCHLGGFGGNGEVRVGVVVSVDSSSGFDRLLYGLLLA